MNNERTKIEYRYMDDVIKNNRAETLIKYLKEKKTDDLEFYDLNMYYSKDTLNNRIINEINRSEINPEIILNKYQMEILDILNDNNIFISAPTSFGKTFIMMEYIKRNEKEIKNIIIIIPTLALMNELLKKLYNLFSNKYNICISGQEELEDRNIFIFVPERSDYNFLDKISSLTIDLLIFDEIYKLQALTPAEIKTDDRLIYMNKVYMDLIKKSRKVALLGPYINSVEFGRSKLNIVKYFTNYLPVYNKIKVLDSNEEWKEYLKLDKQLIYFKSPESIYKNINVILDNIPENNEFIRKYEKEIKYLEEKVNKEWYVISLLKRGIGIHHGKISMYLRKFYENEYNENNIKILLCTNTLMEGINTPTNSLIIVDNPGSPFKMNNLIGRVGRLNPKNPDIGQIIIASEEAANNLNNSNGWMDLKILAEEDEIKEDDEIIYLDKKYNEEKKENALNKKMELFKSKNIDKDLIKRQNLKTKELYIFITENMEETLLNVTTINECVNIGTSLIKGRAGAFFLSNNYKNLIGARNYLPYKYYIEDLLNKKTIKEIVDKFNTRHNITNNKENINKFIDALYQLNNYIKFKLSRFINYIELIDSNKIKENKVLQQFIGLLSNYSNFETTLKIMDDLGINEEDSENILEYLNLSNVTSTSMLIKRLKQNKEEILKLNISPFTKNNIKNM